MLYSPLRQAQGLIFSFGIFLWVFFKNMHLELFEILKFSQHPIRFLDDKSFNKIFRQAPWPRHHEAAVARNRQAHPFRSVGSFEGVGDFFVF